MLKVCETCAHFAWRDGKPAVTEVCLICTFGKDGQPTNWKETSMTNGDRYRAMSDREMAALIYNGISSDPCDYCENSGYCDGAPCKGKAYEEIIEDWLKRPAEEET